MKTSDIFRRAKQLADLEGSDFISWNEAINCINESYIGLFEKLINMGDNSFVKSFKTKEKEEDLPKDFWQLKGVYLWNNGNLQTINRRADNNGIHHLSYELRNGKLYLFGNPNDVLVEYFPKPKKLLMPPSDCEVALELPEGATVLACCEHTFLYKTAEEKINIFDIDGVKNASDIFETFNESAIWINKDFAFTLNDDDLTVYDLATGTSTTYENSIPLVTEDGELFVINDGNICELIFNGDSYGLRPIKEFSDIADGYYYICDSAFTDFYYLKVDTEGNIVYHNGLSTEQNATSIIYQDSKCYYVAINKAGVIEDDENKVIKVGIGTPIGFIGINDNTGYGYATKKYSKYFVCAYCEDTELDFPNSFYYQMLSYLLAIAFRCKQGADVSLLSSQLDMVSQTFEDTLGSDAFQYPRMGNVYN
jgi:hypothetical protein